MGCTMNDRLTVELTDGTATFIRILSARLRVTPNELVDIIVTRRAAELQATADVFGVYDFTEVMTVTGRYSAGNNGNGTSQYSHS